MENQVEKQPVETNIWEIEKQFPKLEDKEINIEVPEIKNRIKEIVQIFEKSKTECLKKIAELFYDIYHNKIIRINSELKEDIFWIIRYEKIRCEKIEKKDIERFFLPRIRRTFIEYQYQLSHELRTGENKKQISLVKEFLKCDFAKYISDNFVREYSLLFDN
jgi:hypothetical protein